MNKKILFFYVTLAAFSLTSFGVMDWYDSETDQAGTSVSEDTASIAPITEETNQKIFVGPMQLENSDWAPYFTVVLKKQTEYDGGKDALYEGGTDALMEYLKENSKEARAGYQMDELPPFELLFTVTKKGTIENAKLKLDGASGYISINNRMIELITKTPGKWKPAENSKGEKVAQELVVSFGRRGC
ncbi:hypothetical protein [Maribacter sp. HTCC2170]|uniref:hypothetical protein n=1 Tax=Maribacter sp. (strain HTCC2170 / KCCM 42371) TaxID=313603 RepID=UPI00006BE0B2|nr:hypothetical protein [Maribacter sp. HTCC2170]EAR00015.1 hypothetical protein FB2170_01537 [Maribacter sp. HTCC2170]